MHEVKRENPERRYETRDVTTRNIVHSAIGLAVLMAVGLASSWLVMKYFVRVQPLGPPASPFDNTRTLPPSPRLQVSPAENLKEYKAKEESKLKSYGWVDRNAGIARIPIERAMEISLRRGFPVRADQASGSVPASRGSGNAATAGSSRLGTNSSESTRGKQGP